MGKPDICCAFSGSRKWDDDRIRFRAISLAVLPCRTERLAIAALRRPIIATSCVGKFLRLVAKKPRRQNNGGIGV